MTFTEIQTEVDSLTIEEQDKLAAYLTLRQKERDPEWNDRISKKIQNKQADRWIPLEQLNSENQ